MDELVSRAELSELCRPAGERIAALLDAGELKPARELYRRIEDARRATCERYRDWMALELEYLHESGLATHPPERIGELASRSGFSLGDLVLAQQLGNGPDNPVAKRFGAAIAAGDVARARDAWDESDRILRMVHDLRRDLISDVLGRVYRAGGMEALEAAQRYAAERGWWSRSMPRDITLDPVQRLRELAFFLVVCAYFRLEIAELEDRWVLEALDCGRCGRQLRERYNAGDWGLEVVNGPGPVTYGLPAMTIYQTHLAVIHGAFAIDMIGAPWPVFECRGLEAGAGGCRLHVYKDLRGTPAAVYAILGRER